MVKVDFEALMASKSDEDLQKYIDDSARYQEAAVSAAINELSNRGGLQNQTIDEVKQQTEEQKKEYIKNSLPEYITTDETAPSFYTKSSIWKYSLITPIFGIVFMFINIEKENYKNIISLIIFAVFAVWLEYINFNFSPLFFGTAITFTILVLLRIIVPYFLTSYFWEKFIGNETIHRKKSTTIPRLMLLIPFAFGIFLMILGFIMAAIIA